MKNKDCVVTLKPVRPKRQYMNNCIITNTIAGARDVPFNKTMKMETIPSKKVSIGIEFTKDPALQLSNPDISQYDMAVMDSIYTISKEGAGVFTPEMVIRVMSGDMELNATEAKMKELMASIEKLAMIRLTIDCTDELRVRNKDGDIKSAKFSTYLLPLEELTVILYNGRKMTGYRLIKKPSLYTYAETVKQMVSVPAAIMECSIDGNSRTKDYMNVKRNLVRRLEAMKNGRNRMSSKTITYEWTDCFGNVKGFFEKMGYFRSDYVNWAKKKKELHGIITSILDEMEFVGYIKGYTVNREGTGPRATITGVTISK